MKLLKTREYLPALIDKFCTWFLSLIAGVRVDFTEIHTQESGRDCPYKEDTPTTILRPDWSNEPRGNDTSRIHSAWSDESYFMGDFKFYNSLRESLREKGLEYPGRYYQSARDRYAGVVNASQKTR